MKKRLLTILLALALAVSMIPTCFAYYTASDTRPTPSQPWYGSRQELCANLFAGSGRPEVSRQ